MAPIIIYAMEGSPPVHSVLSVLKLLNIDFVRKDVNLLIGEQMNAEFVKINPLHTVPTINDNGFIIWDSHAIVTYLIDKYGESNSFMYPTNLEIRTIINQRLHFDSSILFPRLRKIFYPIVIEKKQTIPREDIDNVLDAYNLLESLLQAKCFDQKVNNTSIHWLAGTEVTVADICAANSMVALNGIIPVDKTNFPRITAWLQQCLELPYFHHHLMATLIMFDIIKNMLQTTNNA